MELEPYLHLAGKCEEALHFYQSVLGGEIGELNRFEGSPMMKDLPPDYGPKIMHSSFRSGAVRFMASDGMPDSTHTTGSRVSLAIATDDVAEGERVFNGLAAGGSVTMPYQKTFWGTFGMLTDKYGIDWMVNAGG